MNNKFKLVLGAAALAILLALSGLLYNSLKEDYKQPDNTQNGGSSQSTEKIAAPDFTVYDKDNNPVKLSDFKGKPVVINFWATWCGYCVEEMPIFEKAATEQDGEVIFLMVNATDGSRETQELAQKYINKEGYTFPVYFDTDMDASSNYRVSSLPTTVFVDKEGNIANMILGATNESDLNDNIELIKK